MKHTLLTLLTICLTAAVSAGVYDDAIFWFRGGRDLNGNGLCEKGEFYDEMHAGNTSHGNHQTTFTGYPESIVLRNEDVKFPCGRDTAKSMPVLQSGELRPCVFDLPEADDRYGVLHGRLPQRRAARRHDQRRARGAHR